jgi:pilus assembly protein CpaE
MPDDGAQILLGEAAAEDLGGRIHVLAFLSDAESEAVLRQGLQAAAPEGVDVRRGDCRTAVEALARLATPRVLVVDVSGEEQPMTALAALSEVVEPDVRVLVVGDRQDINLYRQLTRALGVAEYLYKPLSAEVVAQHFGVHVNPAAAAAQPTGGRVLAFTGVRGGAGATTIAANLAWHLAEATRRHTVLVDADLHTGSAAMLLGAKSGSGLRTSIEAPQRVDELFIQRIAQPVGDRLAVIAGEERLSERPTAAPGGVARLLQLLRKRYNFVVLDVPLARTAWSDEFLEQARQRVLVLDPTLPSIREALRVLAMPPGSQQTLSPALALNRLGEPGALSKAQVEDALGRRVDVTLPYLPRVVNLAATTGVPAAAARNPFSAALHTLAQLVAAGGAPPRRRGLLGRLRPAGAAARPR